MTQLPNEQLLLRTRSGSLLLTTHRVRYRQEGGGKAAIVSILLEEVASCSMVRITHPLLALCAVGAFAFGLLIGAMKGADEGKTWMIGGTVLAVALAVAYLVLREHVVEITSAGDRMVLDMESWSVKDVGDLFDRIEAAKVARLSGSVFQGGEAVEHVEQI